MIIEAMLWMVIEAGQGLRQIGDAVIGDNWVSVYDARVGLLLTAAVNFVRAFIPAPALAALFAVLSTGLALALTHYVLRLAKALASWVGLGS